MFWIIRIIICVVILIATIIILKKYLKKSFMWFFVLLIVLSLFYLSVLFPVENRVAKFASPQQIFDYVYQGKVEKVISGKNSCFILYSQSGSSVNSAIFKKEGNLYILNPLNNGKVISTLNKDGLDIRLYRVKDTNDYYITVFGFNNISTNTFNNLTDFQIINTDNSFVACAFVENISDYYFEIGTLTFQTAYIDEKWVIQAKNQ